MLECDHWFQGMISQLQVPVECCLFVCTLGGPGGSCQRKIQFFAGTISAVIEALSYLDLDLGHLAITSISDFEVNNSHHPFTR